MERNYYIFNSGRLHRKDNTLLFENESGEKKVLPVNDVEAIYIFSEIDLNTKLLNFLSQNKIPLHVFNYYGYYSGSYYPREYLNSGFLLVNQVSHYKSNRKRMIIAREFIRSGVLNILKNLQYYNKDSVGLDLKDRIEEIKGHLQEVENAQDILVLMSIEGRIRNSYYKCFGIILGEEYALEKREKRPPTNIINALISFGNSLMYTTVLGEIYRTQLNPLISFLHEPGERRFSLSLDISEIFKPIIIDRLIFKLLNTGMISEKHFDQELNSCYLNEEGKRIFLREYDERLKKTIRHSVIFRINPA